MAPECDGLPSSNMQVRTIEMLKLYQLNAGVLCPQETNAPCCSDGVPPALFWCQPGIDSPS